MGGVEWEHDPRRGAGGSDLSRHVAFVRAGFAVLAYELDGAIEGRSGGAEGPGEDLRKSLAAHAGLVNAEIALEFLLAKVPQVDPRRIVAVGHGTAGTAAILLAENDSRLKGCAALAAPIDLEEWFGAGAVEELRRAGAGDLFTSDSPRANEDRLACPLFLYHARDDPVVPAGQSEACASGSSGCTSRSRSRSCRAGATARAWSSKPSRASSPGSKGSQDSNREPVRAGPPRAQPLRRPTNASASAVRVRMSSTCSVDSKPMMKASTVPRPRT